MGENPKQEVIINTIKETKDEIKSFKQKISDKGNELPEISSIAKSLKGIEKVITDIKKICINEGKTLQEILDELTQVQVEELLNRTELMFSVIGENLQKDMELTEFLPNNENKREISYQDEIIGELSIKEDEDGTLKIKVTINKHEDSFAVESPYKMYPIISFINTKFNYE